MERLRLGESRLAAAPSTGSQLPATRSRSCTVSIVLTAVIRNNRWFGAKTEIFIGPRTGEELQASVSYSGAPLVGA